MNEDFRIAINIKKFILSLDDLLINYPKKEKVLTDKIKSTSFEILELVFLANNKKERLEIQQLIIAKISMLDFYFEISYKKHYINEKQCLNKCNELKNITKMIYGWIKNGKCEIE